MRWPLRYQILFPFAGVMLAVVVGVSSLEAYLAARRTQAQIERQLRDVSQTLLESTFPLTDAVLKQTRGLSGAEFVLTDSAGKARATTLVDIDGSTLPATPTTGESFALGDPIDLGSGEYFHTAISVGARGAQGGPMVLHILYPRRFLQEARWQAEYPPLLVGGGLLVVVVVLATVIAGRLSRPILELRKQLSRLVQGDFQPLPLPRRNDELHDLVASANLLADQLDESRRAIERSERLALLGQLSGGLAHQLRNSVTGARVAVQLHQRRCAAGDRDSLAVALRQLTLTESYLQRFLTVGQPTPLQRESFDPRRVVDEVVELVGPACRHQSVDLQVNGDRSGSQELCADADQLREMLLNLVLNAVEAAGPRGWVRIELHGTEDFERWRVIDSGSGLDPCLSDRLFEPFVTGKPDGIGLGLTVAKRIVEAHGGTIHCHDERPTRFEVTLPRVAPGQPTDTSPAGDRSANGHSQHHHLHLKTETI